MEAASKAEFGRFEQLQFARDVVKHEGEVLANLSKKMGMEVCDAADRIESCLAEGGQVIVIGMGKAGLIGQKLAATLASTGTPAHFVHPAEAMHGDLGRIHASDIALMLSQSGETEEITRLLPILAAAGTSIIAITAGEANSLARAAEIVLPLGKLREACPLGLAPSASTTAMLALGDALALLLGERRGFRPEDFVKFHPGGSLGLKLARVEEVMRPLEQCRVATDDKTVRQVFVDVSRPGRRTGAIMLTARNGRLTGIFTDSDLARLFETASDESLDQPISAVMTPSPASVIQGTLLPHAVRVLAERRISELPVVDVRGVAVGMLDITDVVALLPKDGSPPMPNKTPAARAKKISPAHLRQAAQHAADDDSLQSAESGGSHPSGDAPDVVPFKGA